MMLFPSINLLSNTNLGKMRLFLYDVFIKEKPCFPSKLKIRNMLAKFDKLKLDLLWHYVVIFFPNTFRTGTHIGNRTKNSCETLSN